MKKPTNWRISFIFSVVVLCGAVVMGRLFFLQILQRKLYESQAMGLQMSVRSATGMRGQIFCGSSQNSKGAEFNSDFKSLAINKDNWIVAANIKNISDKNNFAEALSRGIEMSPAQIVSQLDGQESYAVIKKGLSDSELSKVKALKLKGLALQNIPERFYPQGKMLSQTVGFLGGSGSGQYGVEGYYDNELQGKTGIQQKNTSASLDGLNIYLTIDYNIQFQAEELLKAEQKKDDIDSGQIIVMRPDTGKILALANFPNFDPNQYSKEADLGVFQNSSVQKLFEPGSIMKPFTMAAALNEGKITPDTTYVDTGAVVIGPDTIHNFNFEKMGEQTMTGVLENSLNTGAVFAEQKLDHKTFFNYIDKFGFTSKTGVDLQGEVYSANNNLKNGPDFNYATASFGQGIELTPLQIARGFCAIANGGKLVKPYIVESEKPEISDPIVFPQTISQLNAMLINVVDKGFNGVAKIPGYYLAGKTGTAQVPLIGGRGYEQDKTIQSFVGYGPALNPQFLIMVKLDNPKVPKSALSAVPVFKQLAQYIINYWQIPPDYDPATPTK